jgi:Copper transport outer membrane protein, MctB
MLDFRYHALSLVAVFLALGIGIVLGSSLGDTVVSQANRDIANSLRGDLSRAKRDASGAHAAVAQRERLLEAVFPRIADTKLAGQSVAIVASGSLPDGVQSSARDAVRAAGGRLAVIGQLRSPPDIAQLGAAVGPRFAGLRSDDPRLRPLGRKIGTALASGGRLARRLEKRFPDRFGGRPAAADAVVLYRDPALERSNAVKQIEQGLIEGLRASGKPVIGVETVDTDPSQVSFYSNQGLSSVDDLDSAGGRIALVLTLAGARGNYGYKKTADAPLPPAAGATRGG